MLKPYNACIAGAGPQRPIVSEEQSSSAESMLRHQQIDLQVTESRRQTGDAGGVPPEKSIKRADFLVLDAAIPEERERWLALWQSWPNRDVLAHPGYAQRFARPEDRTVCACQIGPDGGILFPLIVRPISVEGWAGEITGCDLVSPYGYGGPFGWGSYATNAFWTGFDVWSSSIGAVSLFARLALFRDSLIPFCGDVSEKGPAIIVSLEPAADSLLASYDQEARRNVRQAERAGVTVEIDRDCTRLEQFLTIYHSTMDRRGARSIYYFTQQFFEDLIAGLPGQVTLFHAWHEGKVVSSQLLVVSETYLYSFLNGTVEEGMRVRANPLLRHAVNLWGKSTGKHHVVLGGGYNSAEDSLFKYKQRYAPNTQVPFCVGTRIFDQGVYQSLIDRRTTWCDARSIKWTPAEGFFPLYRG